jgi:predicted RNA-binding protein with EMAP domain
MVIDPRTTVGKLVNALPSTVPVLQSYGISPQEVTDTPLWKALTDVHADVEEFLRALDDIDWSAEFPSEPEQAPDGRVGAEDRSQERG